ncbi:MAG TPA: serine hydrolase domain-containing protein [Ornithinibacter sp.]|nr:serine hydrolase domain-containing protein [Ornithinibacter sp.]
MGTPDAGWVPAAGSRTTAEVITTYRERIPELMASEHVPGLAVAVVDGDRVLWQEGFGSTDAGGAPVTADTIFSVQSTSKTFTATAVMLAVQAGLVDLDEPITTYLPDFTVHSVFETHPERRITLRMLLSHTAGFTHEAPIGNNYEPEPGSFDAHVRSISATWLRFRVGTGYAYSNLGIDLAGHVLEVVSGKSFPVLMRDLVLGPLGMNDSTFDRARVRATADRAVGHSGPVTPPVDSPMTAAGGLWASAADLGRFLRFQLGNGSFEGRDVLDPALMQQMRTVPAPDAGAPAGYALGVARTHWRAGRYLDLFDHGGGGNGFITDLWWLPQLQLGIAVLTNSSEHHLQGDLALQILGDLAAGPDSPYRDRLLALPTQSDVVEPDSHFVPPPDLAQQIASVAMPQSPAAPERWAGFAELYRTGVPGAMDPAAPPSRFHVESGAPYFDASEDGTPVRHRLVESQPGLFLADNGETLDLRGPVPRWRGLRLNPVTDGPLRAQWILLSLVVAVSAGWLVLAGGTGVRDRIRRGRPDVSATAGPRGPGRGWRGITTAVAALGALAAISTGVGIRVVPGIVDVGYLGWMPFTLPVRALLHVPDATAFLAGLLVALLAVGAFRKWWGRSVRARDAALAAALTALAIQLTLWDLVSLPL